MAKAKAKKTVISQKSGITLRKKKLSNGTVSLYFDITPGRNGKPRDYVFLGLYLTGNKEHDKQVLEAAELAQAQLFIDRQLSVQSIVKPKHQDFFDFFEKKYEKTDAAMSAIRLFKKFYGRNVLLMKDITPELIDKFRLWLESTISSHTKKKLTASCQCTYFNAIMTGIRAACKQKLFQYDFSTLVKPKKSSGTIRRFLVLEEARQLNTTPVPPNKNIPKKVKHIDKNDTKRAYLFACCVGLRLSDVQQLRGYHFSGANVQKLQQKTGEPVYIPLSDQALAALSYLPLNPNELVFKLPVTNTTVNKYLNEWAESAGLRKRITFHSSRHTFATLLLSNNVGIFTVQQLLGHSSINSTLIYAHMLDEVKQQAVQQLPSFL